MRMQEVCQSEAKRAREESSEAMGASTLRDLFTDLRSIGQRYRGLSSRITSLVFWGARVRQILHTRYDLYFHYKTTTTPFGMHPR